MAELLIDIEITLPQSQFLKFKELADILTISVPEAFQKCMMEKCEEYLDMFKNNVPPIIETLEIQEDDNSNTRSTTRPTEGTQEQVESNASSQDGILPKSKESTLGNSARASPT